MSGRRGIFLHCATRAAMASFVLAERVRFSWLRQRRNRCHFHLGAQVSPSWSDFAFRCLQNKRSFRFCSKGSPRALRKFLSQRREFRAAPPTPRCTMLRGGCRRLGTEKSVYFARTDPLHFRQHCPPGGWGGRRETSLAKNIYPLGRRRSSAPWTDNERLFCKHRNKKSPQEGETWAPR